MDPKDLEIVEPCDVSWEAMQGSDCVRHCARCQREVHDLSAMTEADAEALMNDGVHRCIRYAVDDEGRVTHQPPRTWSRRALAAAAGLGLLAGAPALASNQVSEDSMAKLVERVQGWLDWLVGKNETPERREAVPDPAKPDRLAVPVERRRPRRFQGIPPRPRRCTEVAIVRNGNEQIVFVDQSGTPCK